MSSLKAVFYDRDFGTRLQRRDVKQTVNSYAFAAIGGCKEASITMEGGELGLWELINWLRCPVEIYERRGNAVWWGYVHQVRVRQDALEVAAGLDNLANRVAVTYSFVPVGAATVGSRKTTAWADDLDSQAEYGVKEWLSSTDGASDAEAEARRDAILAAQAWPYGGLAQFGEARARVRYSGHKHSLSATLSCRGWWQTLGWKHYANAGVSSVATTAQLAAIVTASGQFLTATDIEAASGVSSSEYRTGDQTALDEVLKLLAAGGPNGRRLLASVDMNRRVLVREEPDPSGSALFLNSQAIMTGKGGIDIEENTPPVAGWCRLLDVVPGVVDLTKIVDPSLQFIEGSSWSALNGARYTFRGQPSIESLLAVK